jgi:cell division protein YceG involved in septum cleavage
MAKKVVASLRNKSGVKYAKLIQSVKSEKSGAYSFKEEIIIEDHVKDILAGKSQQDIINELRAKEKEAEATKLAAQKEAAEAPKEEKKEEAPAAEAPKEEKKEDGEAKS